VNRSNIWQLQSQGDVQGILALLDNADLVIRGRGIMALQAMGAAEAIPTLQVLYHRETNPQLRGLLERALQSLSAPPEEETRDTLLAKLASSHESEVCYAIVHLGKLGDRSVIEHLVILFREDERSAKVRLAAAEALLALQSAPASASLLGALRKDDWQVRRNAAAVLGQLKTDWAVDPLAEIAREDPNLTVRKTAAAALRRINTEEAQAALKKLPPD
jgi:HEAT repeat protein